MSNYNSIVSATKVMMAAGFVILGVGIFLIPSDEEKLRKMKERQHKMQEKYDNPSQVHERRSADGFPFNLTQANKSTSKNEKSESINVFKDL